MAVFVNETTALRCARAEASNTPCTNHRPLHVEARDAIAPEQAAESGGDEPE
jgi:hypothetical protein